MKFYDKYLTPLSKDIQQVILILVVFILGFVVGYFVGNHESKNNEKIRNQVTIARIETNSNNWQKQ